MRDAYRWSEAAVELDRWRAAGRTAGFWLRDDDAIEPTEALDALTARLNYHRATCLLAVIPMRAGEPLASRLRAEPFIAPAMHGAWHANHAPAGSKTEETPPSRGLAAVGEELGAARARLIGFFGEAAGRWYVPPWNRIGIEVAAVLPRLGFEMISAFGRADFRAVAGLRQANTHVDLVDWKSGRAGKRLDVVAAELAQAIAAARLDDWRPIGLLTHHLAHDATAWETLDGLMAFIGGHPAACWIAPEAAAS